jgi:two-component system, NtrC family, response regulator AtoC
MSESAQQKDHDAGAVIVVGEPNLAGATPLLARIAQSDISVLICGEPGTGKEVLARTLHALSGRSGELVAVHAAGLLESELFGCDRTQTCGALERAGTGTVLLDEVGELPLDLQRKLMHALETRRIYRVGGIQPFALRARVVATSRRPLSELVTRGAFRHDLYLRLNGIALELPPLRERLSQLPALAQDLLADIAREVGAFAPCFTDAALDALDQHDWPDNVRELRLVIARAALLAGPAPIEPHHLMLPPREAPRAGFLAVAREHRGNASAIARALSTSRSQVRRLAHRFEVDLDRLRRMATRTKPGS